jgi:hypothetical protein
MVSFSFSTTGSDDGTEMAFAVERRTSFLMALFTETQLRQRANNVKQAQARFATKSFAEIVRETAQAIPLGTPFDIFLSHSFADADLILGLTSVFEEFGYKAYVDWVVDQGVDRSRVTKETADLLRKRMEDSKCLLYASTENALDSKWMPWETGYFDAKKGKVAIVPIAKQSASDNYNGQEYLGLYPYMSIIGERSASAFLLIHEDSQTWTLFQHWLQGEKPRKH